MCVYSLVVDHYRQKWEPMVPAPTPQPQPVLPVISPLIPGVHYPLPSDVDEFRRLLERAREYDRLHGEPDCDMQEKKDALRIVADALGLKIDFV